MRREIKGARMQWRTYTCSRMHAGKTIVMSGRHLLRHRTHARTLNKRRLKGSTDNAFRLGLSWKRLNIGNEVCDQIQDLHAQLLWTCKSQIEESREASTVEACPASFTPAFQQRQDIVVASGERNKGVGTRDDKR